MPLAEAVVFGMLASYILSRTLVPTLAAYLLKQKQKRLTAGRSLNPFTLFHRAFERGFERVRLGYQRLLTILVHWRYIFIPAFLLTCLSAFLLVPWLGQDFFPNTDSGQFTLHLRAKTGTRIEEVARLCDVVENSIRHTVPPAEMDSIIDNIGLPYSNISYIHGTSGFIGTNDADIMVSLKPNHRPTADYVRQLRVTLAHNFPGVMFYFLPADMISQILNFGLPAPVDIQIDGADIEGNRQLADRMLAELRHVPGLVDLHIAQSFDYPKFHIDVDRTKAILGGYTQRDVASSLLVSLSGSFQTTPTFFLDWQNGAQYNLVTQTPQYQIQSLQDLQNTALSGPGMIRPEILANVGSISRATDMEVVSHYNVRRVVDIYGSVQDRDLGATAGDLRQ